MIANEVNNPHEKRNIGGNQEGLIVEHYPSKLRKDLSH